MLIVIPNEGLKEMLERVCADNMRIKLFANDYTPQHGSVMADFTEASVVGYVDTLVVPGDWDAPALSGNLAYTQTAPVAFSATNPNTEDCYGWYLVDGTSTYVVAAARFDVAPTELNSVGLSVIPYLAIASKYG